MKKVMFFAVRIEIITIFAKRNEIKKNNDE